MSASNGPKAPTVPLLLVGLLVSCTGLAAASVQPITARQLLNGTGSDALVEASLAYGWVPKRSRFPYIAALITADGNFRCGGSLINKRLVVTAAHCVAEQITQVLVGLYNWDTDTTPTNYQLISVKKVATHPSYRRATLAYDIAVLRLGADATARPVALAPRGTPLKPGTSLLVAGWGATESAPVSPQLRAAWLPLQPTSVCSARMHMPTTALCLGDGVLKRAGCSGDSGSPVVLQRPGKPDLQVALYSFMPSSYTCGGSGNLGGATSTIKTRAWLNSMVKAWGA